MARPHAAKHRRPARPVKEAAHPYEVEVLSGLEAVARAELEAVPQLRDQRGLSFWYPGDPQRLTRLRSAVAVYRLRQWAIPRPKALLGQQHLDELLDFLRPVQSWGGHRSFRLGAAGKDSSVMQRLAGALEEGLGLPHDPLEGELLLRLRPSEADEGWDVLARLTPRPLSARSWRVCNRSGGLNATIAYALHRSSGQREQDRIFNPMCGSGTLLIERSLMGPAAALVGVDTDPEAVACAQANIRAAGRTIEVAEVDALYTDLPARSFDLIVADLPWGDAIGSHRSNTALYPAFLSEMHRLISQRGRLCVLTHELRLFEEVLRQQRQWQARELFQVASGGHHPKAYLLQRA